MLNEFFGIFAMSGTASSFVGPLAVGILTAAFHSQRAGVVVGCVFLLGGLLAMRGCGNQSPGASRTVCRSLTGALA